MVAARSGEWLLAIRLLAHSEGAMSLASPPPPYTYNGCRQQCEEYPACAVSCANTEFPVMNLLGMVVLVMMSGGFSGLTLGLLSLSLEGLDIIIHGGTPDEKLWAKVIYPVRKRGNKLLCTLLLGNTLVNAMIAILSADLTSGLVGGLLSTGIIVIFGEIITQAICSRHGLRIGEATICIVTPLMFVLSPITVPIATALDFLLGREMGAPPSPIRRSPPSSHPPLHSPHPRPPACSWSAARVIVGHSLRSSARAGMAYNKKQLDKLLELQTEQLTTDDQQLLSSALNFSEKNTGMIMTKIEDVFMVSM